MSIWPGDKSLTWEERFWRRVQKADGCWLWIGGRGSGRGVSAYGIWNRPQGRTTAHRVAYELLVGPIPDGHHLDHLCENPLCVNPDHLEPVTPEVNNLRSGSLTARLALATHCKRGHPLEGANLYVTPSGSRRCRTCANERGRRYSADPRVRERNTARQREYRQEKRLA